MGILNLPFSPVAAYVTMLTALVLIFRNARAAPWKRLEGPGAFSAWCFSVIALPLVWSMDVPVTNGIALHLLGMPLFVLMFGRRLAMVGLGISVIAYTALQDGRWSNLGMNLMLLAVLPAYCGEIVMRATRRFFPHHIFVYLLGNGFFGAMVMLAAIDLISIAAHKIWAATPLGPDTIAYMLLLAWVEAFLTGFLLTIFTVYRPAWVLTFDDAVYLHGK
jgi:uncharacterized membrane protein